jgi:hypothetical protein
LRGIHVVALVILGLPRSCAPALPDSGPSPSDAWFLSGGGRDVYTLAQDPEVPFEGEPSTALYADEPTNDAYGTAMIVFDATPYLGKRLRLSAPIRTEGVTERGDFWVRAQGATSPPDGRGLGSGHARLEPTSGFVPYVLELRVASDAVRIEIGAGIAGPGRLWAGPATWEVVDEPAVPASPVGVWSVTWDRSGTGWQPSLFHGTLILGDGSMGLDWAESSAEVVVRSVEIDGARFRVEIGTTTDPTLVQILEGVVDGDFLVGTATADGSRGSVRRSPLRGRRVTTLAPAP